MEYKLKPKQYIDITDWDYDKRQRFFPHDCNRRKYRIALMEEDGTLNGFSNDYDKRETWLELFKDWGYKPLPKCNNLGEM